MLFVVIYDPQFHDLGRIIRKNIIYLSFEEQVKHIVPLAKRERVIMLRQK